MINAASTCLRKYAVFSGRAARAEYWWFTLFCVLMFAAGVAVEAALGIPAGVSLVVLAALVLPYVAATTRRLHDADFSGWRQLIGFLPFGGLFVLYWTLQPSTGDNKYGPAEHGLQTLNQHRVAASPPMA